MTTICSSTFSFSSDTWEIMPTNRLPSDKPGVGTEGGKGWFYRGLRGFFFIIAYFSGQSSAGMSPLEGKLHLGVQRSVDLGPGVKGGITLKITHKISIDLDRYSVPGFDAVCGDRYAR